VRVRIASLATASRVKAERALMAQVCRSEWIAPACKGYALPRNLALDSQLNEVRIPGIFRTGMD
jgi:hypothetical protein